MIKLEHKNNNTLKLFKSIFDTMIPESNDKKFPKLSDAVNVIDFLKIIFLDINLNNKLNKMLSPIFSNFKDNQNLNYSKLGIKIAESRKIENIIERNLLISYFTSSRVRAALSKKTNKFLSVYKNKKKDNLVLLKPVIISKLKYRKI